MLKKMLFLYLFVPFLLCPLYGQQEKEAPSSPGQKVTAFVNVSVVAMTSEEIQPGQTVIVRDGKIAQMGPASAVEVPAGAQVLDGRGRHLMPGLADMHVHTWSDHDLILYVANGITTIRNMWGSPLHLGWKEKLEKGELFGPSLYTAGPLMDGSPPIWSGSTVIKTPEEAEKAVAEQKKAGYDFIKVYNRLKKDVYDALVKTARKEGLPVAGHVPDAVGISHVLASKQDSIEHLSGYREMIESDTSPLKGKEDFSSRTRRWNYVEESKIPDVVSATVNSETWNCVTLIVYQRFVSPEAGEELNKRPQMKYVDPMTRATWDPSKDFRSKELTAEDYKILREADKIRLKLTGALHKAGARILLGTDTPNPFVIPGFSIHEELRNLVAAGLSPYEAIRAGTADAAEFMGDSELFGTIEPGKRADLILVKGNPLRDVANVSKRVGVMLRGRWYGEEDLLHRLEKLAASYGAAKKRFSGMPDLPSIGERVFSGRYEMKFNDFTIGEERYAIEKEPDGRVVIVSQGVTDAPYASKTTARMEVNPDGTCATLSYENETSMGTLQIKMARGEKLLKVSGTLYSGEKVEKEKPFGKGDLMGAPSVAANELLINRLREMKVGESKELNGRGMEMFPTFSLTEEKLTVKRLPNGVEETRQGIIPVQLYEIKVDPGANPYTSTIALDGEGRLYELKIASQMGSMSFTRIE